MDSTSIDLVGSVITQVEITDDEVKVHFDPAKIIKTMTGSIERTRWYQRGVMIFTKGQVEQLCSNLPVVCAGGDVIENIYTYRGMIPLPLSSRGKAQCVLRVENEDNVISIHGEAIRLEMAEPAKYIEHIR